MTDALQPPMQNDNGVHNFDPTNRKAIPCFRFGTISLAQHDQPEKNVRDMPQVLISTAVPEIDGRAVPSEMAEDLEDCVVENVVQTYTIQVPVTELIDGQSVTRFHTENRSRTVPTKRQRFRADSETGHLPVQQYYTVSVPYSERVKFENESPMSITRYRSETRTRWVYPNDLPVKFLPKVMNLKRDLDSIQCYSKSGEILPREQMLDRLTNPRPALLVNSSDHITPYFEFLLSEDAIIVVDPALHLGQGASGLTK